MKNLAMATLLYINVSPRGDYSISRQLGNAVVQAWKKKNPTRRIIERNLSKLRLRLLTSTGSSAPSLRRNITTKATGKRSRQLTESAIDEHDLAFHGTGCQKFDRSSRLNQREGGLNQGIDLLCRKERENLGQILAQRPWVLPVQHRDAVEGAHATAQARANENIREHGQFGKFRGCSHETKADQDPAAPKRADATTGVGAADGVECIINTRRFHATRKAINR